MLFEPPIDLSWQPPTKPPHYLILGCPRTGSTLLSWAMASHPQLNGTGELFDHAYYAHDPVARATLKLPWQADFPKLPDLSHYLTYYTSKLNGFKLLYGQLDKFPYIWQVLLSAWPDLQVIHLERDLADCVVSYYMAYTRGLWNSDHSSPNQPPKVAIPLEVANSYILNYHHRKSEYQQKLSGLRHITINYDTMTNSWNETCSRIEQFLKIEEISLPQQVRKILPKAEKFVINYQQLQEHCRVAIHKPNRLCL